MSRSGSSRARRSDERQVARWLVALDSKIAGERRRVARGSAVVSGWSANRLVEDCAVREILARGLDPQRMRTFRGRILLEVRCKPRGHVLARVYPTSVLPVFVPSVADLAAGPNGTKEGRFGGEAHRNNRRWRDAVKGTPLEMSYRDDWIQEFRDPHDPNDPTFMIRGLSVLGPRHREREVTIDAGQTFIRSFHLLCRCGAGWLATADVMEALDDGWRVLAV